MLQLEKDHPKVLRHERRGSGDLHVLYAHSKNDFEWLRKNVEVVRKNKRTSKGIILDKENVDYSWKEYFEVGVNLDESETFSKVDSSWQYVLLLRAGKEFFRIIGFAVVSRKPNVSEAAGVLEISEKEAGVFSELLYLRYIQIFLKFRSRFMKKELGKGFSYVRFLSESINHLVMNKRGMKGLWGRVGQDAWERLGWIIIKKYASESAFGGVELCLRGAHNIHHKEIEEKVNKLVKKQLVKHSE
jgi:hypothetical protein